MKSARPQEVLRRAHRGPGGGGYSGAASASAFLYTVAGIVAGGFLNWLFSQKASKELRREAERLRHHTNLILRAMEEAGLAQISRDEHGEPMGLVINLRGVVTGRSRASGNLTVGDEEDSAGRE